MEVDMDLEQRVDSLEDFRDDTRQRLVRIETRLEEMATKTDLALMETRLVKWFTATAFVMTTVMSAIVFATVRFTH